MRRNDLQQEIAILDKRINDTIGSAKLPELRYRPFPIWNWVFAAACLTWGKFGAKIPEAYDYYMASGLWVWRLGLLMVVIAILSTLTWFFRGRGYGTKSEAYADASRRARDLQEKRRELQAELRGLSED